jgi:hypothetical protein
MSFLFAESVPWHEGEEKMHNLMNVPYSENPNSPYLSPGAAYRLQKSPLLALGTLDHRGQPWTTIWGGEAGFAGPIAQSTILIRNLVDRNYDPVVETLLGGRDDGELVGKEGEGRLMAGLTVDMENRNRVKLMGRIVAGSLTSSRPQDDALTEGPSGQGQAQLVVKIEQSLGKASIS